MSERPVRLEPRRARASPSAPGAGEGVGTSDTPALCVQCKRYSKKDGPAPSVGSKIYDGDEAADLVKQLNPKRVIPVQYVNGDPPEGCDQGGVQPFLDAMGGTTIQNVGRSISLPGNLGDTTVITVMR